MNFFAKLLTPSDYGGFWFNFSPAAKFLKHLQKDPQTPENRYNGIEVQKSAYGDAIPLIYGQQRIAITLGWYANFTATPHTDDSSSGGKGGGGQAPQSTLTYSAALLAFLCEGPIAGIGNVWADKAITTTTALNLTTFTGAGGQSPWSYLSTNFSSQAVPYDHTAYVACGSFDLKDSAGMPNLSFEVKGLLQYGGGIVDADPSAVLNDYCTNADHGCNFTSLGSLTNYSNYCIAMGFFLSPLETTQRPAADFINELLETTNSQAFCSAGVLNVVPLADAAVTGNSVTYTPNMTPLFAFTDDDYLYEEGEDPVRVSRKSTSETYNVFRVEYLDRSNNYNTAIAEASDAQDIAINGMRVAPTKNLHMITQASIARRVAQIYLQRNLYFRNSYQFKVRADYCLLEPMDIVSITDTGLNLTNQLVRIIETEDDEEDRLMLTAEELPLGPGGAPVYNWQAAQGYAANYSVAPGSVQGPSIIMAPPQLVDASGGYEIWIAVSGPSASSTWGGCRVLMSMDNTRYKNVGTIYGPARYGTLTATLASGGDPDSTNTLSIQLNNTALTMQAGATADADNMRTICLVGNEVVSYRDATLTGAGAYNLGYLRRGKYGTAIASHASGQRFVRLDGAIFRMPFDPGMIGQTIYFKFQSFNIYQGGLEDLASCTAYSTALTNADSGVPFEAGLTLVPRGDCVAVGNSIFKKTTASSAFDSDCYSREAYADGCSLSWSPNQNGAAIMIGLNSDPTTDQNYTSLDYAWYAYDTTTDAIIYENGSSIGSFGTYDKDTVFSIKYDGQQVRYFKNGILQRVVEDRGKTFFLDSSFFAPGAGVRNVTFGPLNTAPSIPFVARGNCVATATTIKKLGGASAWDSDCYSYEAYANGCALTFQPEQTNLGLMMGINSDPTTDQNFTSLDFTFHCQNSADWYIFENGTIIGPSGTYTTSTVFSIFYDGRFVRYLVNGAVVRQVPSVDKTFFLDSSFFAPNAAVRNVYFSASGSATPAPFIARGNCVVSDDLIQKVGGSSAWDSDCYSINGYTQCHVTFKACQTNKGFMIALNADPVTDSNWPSLDFAWYCDSAGALTIYEGGTGYSVSGGYTTSSVFAITYDGTTVTYLLDGVVKKTTTSAGLTLFMDSSFYDPGAGANSIRFGPTTNLAVMDTPQIGNGAATDVSTNFVGGPVSVGFSNANFNAITFSALKFACTAIVTVTYDAAMSSSAFGGQTSILSLLGGVGSAGEITSIPSDTTSRHYASQYEYTYAAGDAPVISLQGHGSSSNTLDVSNCRLQVEFIKR